MKKIKLGFISFAHGHANSYLSALAAMPEVELVGIADENKGRVEEAVAKYNTIYYADYHDLLATDVEAIVICSENVRHAELTKAAARAKKHVLCEKPLGLSITEMEMMIAECHENGVQLMTAFPCRYIKPVIEAKRAIERGDIGDIVAIKGTNRGSFPGGWFAERELSGGGALLDHTVHVMDLMNWFLNERVDEVYAYASTIFQDVDIDDTGMLHVKFANGVFGVLDTSWSRNETFPTWGDVTMEIVGTQGVISVDSFGQRNDLYAARNGKGVWSYWGDDMDEHLVKGFVQALLNDEPVPITGEDGLKSTAVALAAYESVKTGQPVRM